MRSPPSELPKFKQLDAAIRETLSGMVGVLAQIERARVAKRTAAELLLLQDLERWTQNAKGMMQAARMELWNRTEMK